MRRITLSRAHQLAAVSLIGLAAGCGPTRYPVSGRVTYEDGNPVPAGTVIGEGTAGGARVSVQGTIGPDGTFQFGGVKPGDGAIAGTYKVVVMPVPIPDGPAGVGKQPDVDQKFTKFETSGITFEVKPPTNTLDIKVTAPPPKPKDAEDPDAIEVPEPNPAPTPGAKADPKPGAK